MQSALVVGASGGIGAAVVQTLRERGVAVTALSRSRDGLDVTDEASVAAVLGRLEGPYELVLVASGALEVNGAPPEKSIAGLTAVALADQLAVNCIGPAMVLKHAIRLLPHDRRAVFAALSARVGSIGDNRLGGWHSYRASKAALNQIIRGAAIELARTHPHAVCLALHPGTVKTGLSARYIGRHPAVEPAEAATNLLRVIDGLGPERTGSFFDWAGREIPW